METLITIFLVAIPFWTLVILCLIGWAMNIFSKK